MDNLLFFDKLRVGFHINKLKLLEFVRFDSKGASFLLMTYYLLVYFFHNILANNKIRSLVYAGRIYRHINFSSAKLIAVFLLKRIANGNFKFIGEQVYRHVTSDLDQVLYSDLKDSILQIARRPFGQRLLILSPPKNGQKGVLIVKFSDYFKYFATIFDMDKIGEKFIVVVEPSSIGLFDLDLLCLSAFPCEFIVETQEPDDSIFLNKLSVNFTPVELGANCWVDDRVFFHNVNVVKEYDVIMIAIFADVKRHYHLFEAMSKCQNQIKVALIGVPWPKTIEAIKEEAKYYNVENNIVYFENIDQKDINDLLNKSKCFLLLSKKEGSNKSGIEALFANTPSYYLEGYNYGHHYPFINKKTGGFIHPRHLDSFLKNIDSIITENKFTPREWAEKNFSPQVSTSKLKMCLDSMEHKKNIKINKQLEIKINNPNLDYYDAGAWVRLKSEYEKLISYLR